jgi:hypothetical protein
VFVFDATQSQQRARKDADAIARLFPEPHKVTVVVTDLGLRAHVHPGHEDIQLPSPLLRPLEALEFVLYRCRLRRDTPRS